MRPCLILAALGVLAPAAWPGADIKDDEVRSQVLRAAFPNSRISRGKTTLKWVSGGWGPADVPDGLQGEPEFVVAGAVDRDEEPWASDVLNSRTTSVRRLRMKLFQPAGAGADTYVLIAHYTFPGVSHPMCCSYMGRVYLIRKHAAGWDVRRTDSLIQRATSLGSILLADLNGDHVDEVAVETENSGVGENGWFRWMRLTVFDISGPNLRELVRAQTAYQDLGGSLRRSALNVEKTRLAGASRFYFVQKVYQEKDRKAAPVEMREVVVPSAEPR